MTGGDRTPLEVVRGRIETAAAAADRDPAEITLLAVSKLHPVEAVERLRAQGQRDFGESRAQELVGKAVDLDAAGPPVRWHFVGRLQTNKARLVAGHAAVVHSVDRLGLVAALGRVERSAPLEVLIQVSLDGDPARGGADAGEIGALADAVAARPVLHLAGVMAVAVPTEPARPQFARLRAIAEQLQHHHPGATAISAGMSDDLEDAIAEGSTLVRVGTALFGPRGT